MDTLTNEPEARPRRSGSRGVFGRRAADVLLGALGLAIIIACWWVISAHIASVRLASPPAVWQAMWGDLWTMPALTYATFMTGGIADGLVYTAVNVTIGVSIGAALGFATGLLMGRVKVAAELLELPLLVLGTIPVLILLPFMVTWFGTARIAQSGLVIFFSFVTVTGVVRNAVINVSGAYEQSAASLGAGPWLILRDIIRPAMMPEVLGAIRVSFAAGWGFEAIAEILGSQRGIGRIMQAMSTLSATPDLMACLAWLGITAVLVDGFLVLIGRWSIRWRE